MRLAPSQQSQFGSFRIRGQCFHSLCHSRFSAASRQNRKHKPTQRTRRRASGNCSRSQTVGPALIQSAAAHINPRRAAPSIQPYGLPAPTTQCLNAVCTGSSRPLSRISLGQPVCFSHRFLSTVATRANRQAAMNSFIGFYVVSDSPEVLHLSIRSKRS